MGGDRNYGKSEKEENRKDINIIGMVESERHIGDRSSTEIRYYISGLENDAKRFGEAVREHRNIENSLHRVSDISFREDESRLRKGNAAENFAILRHIAPDLPGQEKSAKGSTEAKRMRAGWDNDYLPKVPDIRKNQNSDAFALSILWSSGFCLTFMIIP